MPYFCLSDGFHRAPAVETLSMAARGLFATVASWVGGELYETPGYDGTFDQRRCRMLGGTPKQIRELVDSGLFETVSDGVWRINESRRTGGFDSNIFKNPAKVRAGRKGGMASHATRTPDGWETFSTENDVFQNEKPNDSNGSTRILLQADSEQTTKHTVEQNASNGQADHQADGEQCPSGAQPVLAASSDPQEARTNTSPNPSTPSRRAESGQAVTMADVETRIRADPLTAIASAYPQGHAGDRAKAETAMAAVDVEPTRLYGAALRYTRAVGQDPVLRRQVPNLAKWLREKRYEQWLPPAPPPVQHRNHEHSWNCQHVQTLMKPHEGEYSHEREHYEPSEWMTACQAKADQLNRKEQQA